MYGLVMLMKYFGDHELSAFGGSVTDNFMFENILVSVPPQPSSGLRGADGRDVACNVSTIGKQGHWHTSYVNNC